MYELYEYLKHEKSCLSYLGTFNDEITEKLVQMNEGYLAGVQELSKLKHRVSYLIVECFQNVMRHGEASPEQSTRIKQHRDFFQSSVYNDRVVLSSSNLIENEHIEDLEHKIQQVNSLDVHELKDLYHNILSNQVISSKGGAGLGLIEMARKSGLPIKNHFKQMSADFSEFFIGLEIVSQHSEHAPQVSLMDIESFYKTLVDRKILMLYKGDLSKDTISYLIEMLQTNFGQGDEISSQQASNIITLIEVLQNVSKHGKAFNDSKDGIFTISEQEGALLIECGNFVEQKDYPAFKEKIEKTKSSSIQEITKTYKRRLLDPLGQDDSHNGLGLLEIARNSQNNFDYKFIETSDNEIFFSIKVKTSVRA